MYEYVPYVDVYMSMMNLKITVMKMYVITVNLLKKARVARMEIRCKKCGSTKVFTDTKGNQTGIYCSDCGKWIKWATKEEIRLINHKGMSAEEKLDKIEQIVNNWNGSIVLSANDWKYISEIKEVLEQE